MTKKIFSLPDWLNYLNKQHHKTIDMSLDRIKIVAKKLDLIDPAPLVITVAGTNGKGTTCRMLELILLNMGLKVGVYSSPHLIDYRERVRIQGKLLNENEFCNIFSIIESERHNISLTYFEYGTLAALFLFKNANLDVVILEVGLGGRFDATNIVDPIISVITSIALDHTHWLGTNLEDIGYQKAGILRPNNYAVIGEFNIPNSVYRSVSIINAKLFCYQKDWKIKKKNKYWSWVSSKQSYHRLPYPHIPLINAGTALAVINCLIEINVFIKNSLLINSIHYGLINATLPGRFHVINDSPQIILDVAHNPHAAILLAKRISKISKQQDTKIYAFVGMLIDKDIKGTIEPLLPYIDNWYLVSLTIPRGADAKILSQYLKNSLEFITTKDAWLHIMSNVKKHDIIVVYGSFYVVSEIMKLQKINCFV